MRTRRTQAVHLDEPVVLAGGPIGAVAYQHDRMVQVGLGALWLVVHACRSMQAMRHVTSILPHGREVGLEAL